MAGQLVMDRMRSGKSLRTSWRDGVGMAAAVLLMLIVSYVLSYRRIFWEDEMLGWMLLRDPSWRHMVTAWQAGADGGGFLFYLSGRAWLDVFGPSAVSFRLYSAAGFGAAMCVAWVTMRRVYGVGVVGFALVNTWFFSPPIVTHMAEGRFYGLLMLGTALAGWLVVKARETEDSPWWLCGLAFVLHGSLVTSHMLGVVYSVALLVSLMVVDWLDGRVRPLLYGSAVLSWLLLLPERAAIRASAMVGKPHFWTTPPTVSRFLGAYTAFSGEVAVVLLVLGALVLVSLRGRRVTEDARTLSAMRRALYGVTGALLLVPVCFGVAGFFGTSLFTSRYLMPVAIAQAFLTAEAITWVDWRRLFVGWFDQVWRKRAAVAAYVCVLAWWVFVHVAAIVPQHVDYTGELTAKFTDGLPVVCEDAWAFTEIIGQQHDSGVQYVFLLDWPQSMSPGAPKLEVTEYHLMENWRKVGYFSGSIQPIDDFLREHARFYLLHRDPPVMMVEPDRIGNPLFERFSRDPAYQVLPVGERGKDGLQMAWMVCRGNCARPGGPYPGPLPVE